MSKDNGDPNWGEIKGKVNNEPHSRNEPGLELEFSDSSN